MNDPEYTLMTDEELQELYTRSRDNPGIVYDDKESFDVLDKPGMFRHWWASGLLLGGIAAVAYLFWRSV